jgi:hypothetical protein
MAVAIESADIFLEIFAAAAAVSPPGGLISQVNQIATRLITTLIFFYRLETRLDALGVAKDFASSNPLKKLGIAANRIIRFFPLLHFRAEFKEGCTVESYKISDLIKMMIFLAFVLLCNANNGIRIFFK